MVMYGSDRSFGLRIVSSSYDSVIEEAIEVGRASLHLHSGGKGKRAESNSAHLLILSAAAAFSAALLCLLLALLRN